MTKSTMKLSIVALCLSLFVATDEARAISVGWNFSHSIFADENLAANETAGAPGFAQANWNNHLSAGQAPGATPLNGLTADDGGTAVATTVDVVAWSQSASNSWHYNGHPAGPDDRLTGGFANQDPTITFAGVNTFTDDGYSVVVYYGNNEFNASPGATLDVNGQVQGIQTSDSNANVGYILNTDNGATDSNYAVFTGVSGDVLTVDLQSPQNDGIGAIQIIAATSAVPEPSTLVLFAAGALGLVLTARRRRRNRA